MDSLKEEKVSLQEIAHNRMNDNGMISILKNALMKLREIRPEERSGRSRRYAVTITEMEKVVAYFETWVINEE